MLLLIKRFIFTKSGIGKIGTLFLRVYMSTKTIKERKKRVAREKREEREEERRREKREEGVAGQSTTILSNEGIKEENLHSNISILLDLLEIEAHILSFTISIHGHLHCCLVDTG